VGVVVCRCVVLVFGAANPRMYAKYEVIVDQFGLRGGVVALQFPLEEKIGS
jgi:hypothetical protein